MVGGNTMENTIKKIMEFENEFAPYNDMEEIEAEYRGLLESRDNAEYVYETLDSIADRVYELDNDDLDEIYNTMIDTLYEYCLGLDN